METGRDAIRSFRSQDTERVMQIWLEGNLDAHGFVPEDYWRSNVPAVQEQLGEADVYVYEREGEICGFAGMTGDYLAGIFVDKTCRDIGIGKRLLSHVKKLYPHFKLSVYRENRRAAAFYLREGLRIVAEGIDRDTGKEEYTMVWEVNIRPYEKMDFERLAQIHDGARKNELALAGLSEAFVPFEQAAVREDFFDYKVYVAEYDGTVAGFIAFNEEEIAWLYVDIDYSRRGIGRSLVNFALQRLGGDVSIEVLAGNEPAAALYASFGFQIQETLSGVMPGNEEFPVTVHVMRREMAVRQEQELSSGKRKVVLFIAMSLDGYIADANGGVEWLNDADGAGEKEDSDDRKESARREQPKDCSETDEDSYSLFIKDVDTVIMGWNTYHQIVTELSPDEWVYGGMKTYVLTHRNCASTEEIRFCSEKPSDLLRRLKAEDGKNIWICGGADVVRQLMREDLIDAYDISVIPTLLGGGVRLFDAVGTETKLRLKRTKNSGGIVELVYERRD